MSQPDRHLSLMRNSPFAFDRAAPAPIAGAVGIGLEPAWILLVDAIDANAVLAVVEPLSPFGVGERPLQRVIGRRQRQVVIGRQREKIGHADAGAEVVVAGDSRRQHAALPRHRRIGRGEIRNVGDRHACDFKPGVLEIDDVGLLVLDDFRRPHLPQRRFFWMSLARFAGGVDAVVEHRHRSRRALDAGRSEAGACRFRPPGRPRRIRRAKSSVRSKRCA